MVHDVPSWCEIPLSEESLVMAVPPAHNSTDSAAYA